VCLAVVLLLLAYVIGEIASIVILSGFVGWMYTVLAIVAGAALGSMLVMGRAAATLRDAAEALAKREPVGEMVAASALAAFAGVLLIAPGLLSDAIALILLVPPTRGRLARRMAEGMRARAQVVVAHMGVDVGPGSSPGDVIDVDGVETRAPGRAAPRAALGVTDDDRGDRGDRDRGDRGGRDDRGDRDDH
jgi:UPF0716 protein FxsA